MRGLVVLEVLLGVLVTTAAANPRPAPERPPCGPQLDANPNYPAPISPRLLANLNEFQISELPDFRGHVLLRGGGGLRYSLAPDLIFNSATWRRELWRIGRREFWFYDVGFRNLENDATDLNASVFAQIINHPEDSHLIMSSERRRRDLRNLHQFRFALHERVLDEYRTDSKRHPYLLNDIEALIQANRHNSNVDVFGVLDQKLPWDAEAAEIKRHTVITVQISYDEYADFFSPDPNGMLQQLNLRAPSRAPLPFMRRLPDSKARQAFMSEYEETFAHARVCEIARYLKTIKNLDSPLRQRLLYEVLKRARQRGCTVLIASVKESSLRLFEGYGFRRFRALPTGSAVRESLAYLHVNSPEFIATYARLITTHAGLSFHRAPEEP